MDNSGEKRDRRNRRRIGVIERLGERDMVTFGE